MQAVGRETCLSVTLSGCGVVGVTELAASPEVWRLAHASGSLT